MPHPWVARATLKNGQIVIAVELDKYLAGKSVEISGYVTQNDGGFATVYDIQIAEPNEDGTVVMYVKATPSQAFQDGEDLTVALRASRNWVTVLAESQDEQQSQSYLPASDTLGPAAKDGTSWDHRKAVAWASPLSMPSGDQTSAGNADSFRAAH